MLMNIVAGIMCVICVAAGIWGWWFENGGRSETSNHKMDAKEQEQDDQTDNITTG